MNGASDVLNFRHDIVISQFPIVDICVKIKSSKVFKCRFQKIFWITKNCGARGNNTPFIPQTSYGSVRVRQNSLPAINSRRLVRLSPPTGYVSESRRLHFLKLQKQRQSLIHSKLDYHSHSYQLTFDPVCLTKEQKPMQFRWMTRKMMFAPEGNSSVVG